MNSPFPSYRTLTISKHMLATYLAINLEANTSRVEEALVACGEAAEASLAERAAGIRERNDDSPPDLHRILDWHSSEACGMYVRAGQLTEKYVRGGLAKQIAEGYYKKALGDVPSGGGDVDKLRAVAANNYGSLIWSKERMAEAEEIFRRAVKLNREYVSGLRNLALVLRSPGKASKTDLKEAQEVLVQAVEVTRKQFEEEAELDSWGVDDASPTRTKSMKTGWKQEQDRQSER